MKDKITKLDLFKVLNARNEVVFRSDNVIECRHWVNSQGRYFNRLTRNEVGFKIIAAKA